MTRSRFTRAVGYITLLSTTAFGAHVASRLVLAEMAGAANLFLSSLSIEQRARATLWMPVNCARLHGKSSQAKHRTA